MPHNITGQKKFIYKKENLFFLFAVYDNAIIHLYSWSYQLSNLFCKKAVNNAYFPQISDEYISFTTKHLQNVCNFHKHLLLYYVYVHVL